MSKTNFIIYTSNKKSVNRNVNISIENNKIERVSFTKVLGVYIKIKLFNTFLKNINEIEKKVAKNIVIIKRVSFILDSDSLFTLYCSLILPYFQYCVIKYRD